MKTLPRLLGTFFALLALPALAADIKISQLPLGTAASSSGADSFPYVSASTNITKRLTLWDIANVPTLVSTYATKSNPSFTGNITTTGVITAPSFVGALTGNASTASALSGTLGVAGGGTGLVSGTAGGVLAFTGTTTLASSALGSAGQVLRSAGTAVPTWSTATYPASTTANQLLYSSASNTIGGLATTATGVLVTSSAGVPSVTACTTANRVLRTDGTTLSCGQVAAATDVSGQVAIANGGTGAATKAAGFDALSPMTTGGDLIYGGASGTGTRLANGTAGQVLLSSGGTSAPTWGTQTVYSYSGYFSAGGSFTRNSSSYGDFSVVSTPVLTQRVANNLTVTAAASSLPGITFTSPFTGTIMISAVAKVTEDTVNAFGNVRLEDANGPVIIADGQLRNQGASNSAYQTIAMQGTYNVTASTAYTFKLIGSASSGAVSMANGDNNQSIIEWSVYRIW